MKQTLFYPSRTRKKKFVSQITADHRSSHLHQSSQAPTSPTAAPTTNRPTKLASTMAAAALLDVAAGVAAALLRDGVVSPLTLEALPRMELTKEHTVRMLLTSEGRSGVLRTAVWFVFSKLAYQTMS